ncbi:MAG: phenylalanine--tRNA ligase subunit beta, partial [Verrucomicrobiota bacterium]
CQVDDGTGKPRQIVCGAKNYKVGDKVPLALPGAKFGDFEIKAGELRGEESHGMMCSAKELNISEDADGLMILPKDLKPGTLMRDIYPPVYEIEVTPNRPDQLCHLGIARELGALLGSKVKGKKTYDKIRTSTRLANDDEIKISDSETCPFYTGRIIRGVKVKPSPRWLQEKLTSIGLRPINNIVDITNYVLMEMGQPLHAFDLAKLDGGIHVRRAAEGEKFLALDGETYELSDADCVIADSKRPHAVGGVMGGEDSGVVETTTDILLEAAYFTPSFIRRTSHRLNLHSDSSYRFERGVDPAQVLGASELAARLVKRLAKGVANEEIMIAGEIPNTEFTVPLDNKHVCRLIGQEIPTKEIGAILRSLGLKKKKEGWQIPTWRLDLRRHVDLIEEVARVYGLERLESKQVAQFSPASKSDAEFDFRRGIRQHLTSLGFCECQTIKMISESQLKDDVVTQHRNMTPVRVKNPMTDTHSILRPGLTPSLIRVAEHNVRMGLSSLRLFEIGTTFVANPKGMEIEQPHLALLFTGAIEDASWKQTGPENADIHAMRGVIESLCGRPVIFKTVKD